MTSGHPDQSADQCKGTGRSPAWLTRANTADADKDTVRVPTAASREAVCGLAPDNSRRCRARFPADVTFSS